ncbi:hypothetical protein [Nocardia sp. NPDC052112]|uniref:hypothetical protein n=1 Tax=Nocardia sp. NPDC052112 TaxID=3155646 RepID=UPI00343A421A
MRDHDGMSHGLEEPTEPHPASRESRQPNRPKADLEIISVDGHQDEALTRQQADILLKIARWQTDHQDGDSALL